MAIIEGQIEPLKKLRNILDDNGITRFNSIGEINDFTKNYESEKSNISKRVEKELDSEINDLQTDLSQSKEQYNQLKSETTDQLKRDVEQIKNELEVVSEKRKESLLRKIFLYPKSIKLRKRKTKLDNNFDAILRMKTRREAKNVSLIQSQLDHYENNREAVITARYSKLVEELEGTKRVVDELYPLIAGAIGENAVIKEVEKLSDDFHLFNDYSIEFNPPLYKRKDDDRIYSIQIDHLLVGKAGIFILETKNWSKKSVDNIDLRSPVKQIKRSSYALFVLLNSQSKYNRLKLEKHHWGSKKVPVKNLIVMTNEKPQAEFKHVKVLSLDELQGYVTYFDPIFSDEEVKNICDYLKTYSVHQY